MVPEAGRGSIASYVREGSREGELRRIARLPVGRMEAAVFARCTGPPP